MSNRFEVVNGDIEPQEHDHYASSFEAYAAERRKAFAELSVEPEPRMAQWTDHVVREYEKEWNETSDQDTPEIPVYFIPFSRRAEALRIMGLRTASNVQGKYDEISRAVVVFTGESEFPLASLYSARTLRHELAHAYGISSLKYRRIDTEAEKISLTIDSRLQGMALFTGKGGYMGSFLEEFYAVEQELRALVAIPDFFPDESRLEQETLSRLTRDGTISSQTRKYVSILDHESGARITSDYMTAHQLGSRILLSIPDGWSLLRRARMSENWSTLSREVDAKFGPATFKTMVRVDPKSATACTLFSIFFDTTDKDERDQLAEQIVRLSSR